VAEGSFGEKLSTARRRKGLSISQVSETLRIRTSIIEALETATFEHMPLKGYARNMVSTYARYLGLDPAAVTEMFLREYHVYETREQRRAVPILNQTPPQNGNVTRRSEGEPEQAPAPVAGLRPSRRTVHLSQRNTSTKTFWRGDQAAPSRQRGSSIGQTGRAQAELPQRNLIRAKPIDNRAYSGKRPSAGGIVGAVGGRFSGIFRSLTSRPILLVVALVVVAVILLVLIATAAGSCSRRDADVVMPVVGANNAADGISEEELGANMDAIAQQNAENARYGPFELRVSVHDGDTWLEITVDGQKVFADVATPSFAEVYHVASEASIVTAAPGYVTVLRNESEVQLEIENGLGVAEMKVEQKPVESAADSTSAPNANSSATQQ
jgi:hypothetical protein